MQQNLPTVSRRIGEHEYTVSRLGFRDARRLLEISERVLSPGIVQLISGFDAKKALESLLSQDASSILQGILEVLGRLGSKESDEIFRLLGTHTEVDDEGKRIRLTSNVADNQDQWWALYPGECLLWLVFCYEVQYKDFFLGPARALKNILPQAPLRGE